MSKQHNYVHYSASIHLLKFKKKKQQLEKQLKSVQKKQ